MDLLVERQRRVAFGIGRSSRPRLGAIVPGSVRMDRDGVVRRVERRIDEVEADDGLRCGHRALGTGSATDEQHRETERSRTGHP